MGDIHSLYRHFEDPIKAPPTYSYSVVEEAFIFVVTSDLVQSPFLIACKVAINVKTYLQL